MAWKTSPKIKIIEALGCIADKRIELMDENSARVYSSNKDKAYTVRFDPEKNAINANDNASMFQGYLGYPAVAFLMLKGILSYNEEVAKYLEDILWKKINDEFKKNLEGRDSYIKSYVEEKGGSIDAVNTEVDKVYNQMFGMEFNILWPKPQAPEKLS